MRLWMTNQTRLLLPALALAASVGCATIHVRSYLERGADLGRYRTYALAPADRAGTGDPRLDDNPVFDKRVRENVDAQMVRRGFAKASARPDLLVHYHASVAQRIEPPTSDRFSCEAAEMNPQSVTRPPSCEPYVYDAGTLLIDLVDTRTKALVWRGWAEAGLGSALQSQELLEARVDDSVKRIFNELPRRP